MIFHKGQTFKINYDGMAYTTYPQWFEFNKCNELKKYYDYNKDPPLNVDLKVVFVGIHKGSNGNNGTNEPMVACENIINHKIYLLGCEERYNKNFYDIKEGNNLDIE